MQKRQLKRNHLLLTLCLILCIGMVPNVAESKVTVSCVFGDILLPPEGLNEGDSLAIGQVIQTAPGAYVVLDYTWPSDVDGYHCLSSVWIRNGATYTVQNYQTPGRCATTIPVSVDRVFASPGPAVVPGGTTYADAPYDGWMPDHVSRSRELWSPTFRRVRHMWKSFTGIVSYATTYSGGAGWEITISPQARAGANHSRTFQVPNGTSLGWVPSRPHSGPLPDWTKVGQKLRIDYNPVEGHYPAKAKAVFVFPPGTY
jgi:hypothetical protein